MEEVKIKALVKQEKNEYSEKRGTGQHKKLKKENRNKRKINKCIRGRTESIKKLTKRNGRNTKN